MKISAKFLLSGILVFLCVTALQPVSAQTWPQYVALKGTVLELEMKLQDQQKDIQNLAKKQDALTESIKNAEFDIDFLKSMRGFADTKTDDASTKLNTVESKHYATEDRLTRAEETIEVLNLRLLTLEARASKPKAPASHPKGPVNKPTPAKMGTH